MAFSKDFSGLGFTETRKMNIALLAKWIIKIESDDKSLCIELLRRKYLVHGGLFQHKGGNVSQFWRGLLNIKRWMSFGSEWVLGNGESISFWQDVWWGTCPLKTLFPVTELGARLAVLPRRPRAAKSRILRPPRAPPPAQDFGERGTVGCEPDGAGSAPRRHR